MNKTEYKQNKSKATEASGPSGSTTNRRVLTCGELKQGSQLQSIFQFKTDKRYLWIQEHIEFLQWKPSNTNNSSGPRGESSAKVLFEMKKKRGGVSLNVDVNVFFFKKKKKVWSSHNLSTNTDEQINPLQSRLQLPRDGYIINDFVISRTDIKGLFVYYLLSLENGVEAIEPSSLQYRTEDGTVLTGVYSESDKYFYFEFSEHWNQQMARKQEERLVTQETLMHFDESGTDIKTKDRPNSHGADEANGRNSVANAPKAFDSSLLTQQRSYSYANNNSDKYQVGDFRVKLTGVAERSNVLILGEQKHDDLLKPFEIMSEKLQLSNVFGVVFCQRPEECESKKRLLLQHVVDQEVNVARSQSRALFFGGMFCSFLVVLHAYGQLVDKDNTNDGWFNRWTRKFMDATGIIQRCLGSTHKISSPVSEILVSLLYSSALFGVGTLTGRIRGQRRALLWKTQVVDAGRERIYTLVAESDDSGESEVEADDN
ncbi:hypothetical protein RFI_00850 [Reticulomyxa filosa]|uniref:Uncharacterized protein n=1 Tax=Reticulomyxa filosa TaxID=46433 RepID=X6PEV4_RETFI|nr:hypothetical protein RFI_00850 [Reticulomyxa filosa]|eukprot:ETO36212.1 hypothetical protein RFI_00850 [Reticulomyxa filosa]